MFVLVERINSQNEGLCLKISVEGNIVLHMNIQKVIPELKTVSKFLS